MQIQAPAVRAPAPSALRARAASFHAQLVTRKVYGAGAKYVACAACLAGLGEVVRTSFGLPPTPERIFLVAAAAGFPLALVGAWLFDLRREQRAAAFPETAQERTPRPAGYVNNLHAQPTPFVGRERELAQVASALAQPGTRLVTITGPGGIGKTRLALEAARHAADAFAHGVCVVPLAGVRSAELIAPAMATALRLALSAREDPRTRVPEYLREKRMLLVLDNFEHLTGGAPFVGRVLQAAPGVRVLVTSRERLGVAGEHLVPLYGMELAASGEEGGEGDAVRLFLEGASRVSPEFSPSTGERDSIRRICALVEGLPLAIELASPWVRVLSCAEIEREITESRDFLVAKDPGAAPRHRSLRSAFEWSWRHLDQAQRRALARLAVFRGGFDRAAARAVAGADVEMLRALEDRSLVRMAAPGRFEILDLLRRYAEAELRADEDAFAETRQLHCAVYAARMREVVREQPGSHALRDRVADELRNLRRAAEWAAARGAADDLEMLLLGAYAFWDAQGRALEGDEPFAAAIAAVEAMVAEGRGGAAAERLLGVAMLRHGALLALLGRAAEARERLEAGLARARARADRAETAFALQQLAVLAWHSGDLERAEGLQEEALQLWEVLGDGIGTGRGLTTLGNVALARGEHERARELYGRAVELLRRSGEPALLCAPLCNLGIIASLRHEYPLARRLLGESLDEARKAGNPRAVANGLQILGASAWEVGDHAAALEHAREGVRICREMGFRRLLAFCLNLLGNVFVSRGEPAEAAGALLEALAVAAEVGEAPLTLDVLLGVARLRRAQQREAEATELAALLQHHPATDQDTRTRSGTLADELAAALQPADFAAASSRGRASELGDVVAGLLRAAWPAAAYGVTDRA